MSKQRVISTEAQLQQAAKDALGQDDLLRWRWKTLGPKRGRDEVDALLELDLDGRKLVFEVEFKIAPSARSIERLAARKSRQPQVLIAPSLSEVLVQHCRDREICCIDLNGRQWIRAHGFLVDRKPWKDRRYRPSLSPPDPFQTKSSRLVRVLLSEPHQTWTQGELTERTGLSRGLVSRLVRHLVDEGYAASENKKFRVKQFDALLDAWARRDAWAARTTVRQYSLLDVEPEAVARKLVEVFSAGEALVFTQWFAANLRHPYTTTPLVSAYVTQFPAEQIERRLRARQVGEGGGLWLVVPKDDGVFRATQRVGDFTLACDAQIYLDLLHAGLRGPDQAKALRDWDGFGGVKR